MKKYSRKNHTKENHNYKNVKEKIFIKANVFVIERPKVKGFPKTRF